MTKRVFVVLAVLVFLGGGLTLVAAAHETREAERAASDGMMGSRMGMMGRDPMMSHMAGMGMRSGHGSAEGPWLSMALHHRERLSLSPDQTKTLESLRSEFEKKAIRQSAEIRVAEVELADLLRTEPVDMTKVEAALGRIEGLRTELRLTRIKTMEQGKAVLTPEQRKKLASLGSHHWPHADAGMMGGGGHSR
jgi:Spy/CpxP family protein refolding chaperone